MNHPLSEFMQYLPPVQKPSAPRAVAVDPSGFPPLNIASVSKSYFGRKAFDYDLGRDDTDKWKVEYAGIKDALATFSGTLLDIPCGTGRFFPIYRERGIKFVGMDISEDMLHQAKAKDPQAQLAAVDIANGIPLKDKAVDLTVCSQFLKFLPDQELAAALREIGRVTRHNILCSIFTSDKPTFRGGNRNWVHQLAAFNAMIEAANFKLVGSCPIDPARGHHIWMCEAA